VVDIPFATGMSTRMALVGDLSKSSGTGTLTSLKRVPPIGSRGPVSSSGDSPLYALKKAAWADERPQRVAHSLSTSATVVTPAVALTSRTSPNSPSSKTGRTRTTSCSASPAKASA